MEVNDRAFCDQMGITGIQVELRVPRMSRFGGGDMPPVSARVHLSRLTTPAAAEYAAIRAWAADKMGLPAGQVRVSGESVSEAAFNSEAEASA